MYFRIRFHFPETITIHPNIIYLIVKPIIQSDGQILETLKSSRCVLEVLEWCSPDEVTVFLAHLREHEVNLAAVKTSVSIKLLFSNKLFSDCKM